MHNDFSHFFLQENKCCNLGAKKVTPITAKKDNKKPLLFNTYGLKNNCKIAVNPNADKLS